MPRWPSWLGRQTHRVYLKRRLSPEKSGGHGLESRPGHQSILP
jgi:hypothetical protein